MKKKKEKIKIRKLTKKDKIYYESKKIKSPKKLKEYLFKNANKKERKLIEKHLIRYKRISHKKIKEIFGIDKTDREILILIKQENFYRKYKIKKEPKGFFEGKFYKFKYQLITNNDYLLFKLKSELRLKKSTIEKMKKGKKLSKQLTLKIESFIQNKLSMIEKLALVEGAKLMKKGKKVKEIDLGKLIKKLNNKVEKLKKDLTENQVYKFKIYEFIY